MSRHYARRSRSNNDRDRDRDSDSHRDPLARHNLAVSACVPKR